MPQLSWTKTNPVEWRGGDFRIVKVGWLFDLFRAEAKLSEHPALEAAMDQAEKIAANE